MAREAVEFERGKHATNVFIYKGKPIARMNATAWRNARERSGLEYVRVHDLKHTFGRRLRAEGVSFEDRQDLLGHRSGRITTHYSSAELQNLYEAANKVCEKQKSGVVFTLLRNPNLIKTKSTTQTTKCLVYSFELVALPHNGFLGFRKIGCKYLIYMVARAGIEPATRGFSVLNNPLLIIPIKS